MGKFKKLGVLMTIFVIALFSCKKEITLVSIEITTQPERKTYTVGDVFDITGMVVSAIYSDDSKESVSITDDMLSYDFMTAGTDKTVTITYGGKTAIINGITVFGPEEFELGSLQKILNGYCVKAIAFDSKGNTWIGTLSQGLIRYNEKETMVYNSGNSVFPKDFVIWDIAVDKNDNVWIGTTDGVWKYDGKEFILYNSKNTAMPEDIVWNIAVDSNNNIWMASCRSQKGGLVKYDGTNWTAYTPDNSALPENLIDGVAVDQLDNVWLVVGNYVNQRYLVKISNDTWKVYDKKDLGFTPWYGGSIQCDSKNRVWGMIGIMGGSYYNPPPHFFIFNGEKETLLTCNNLNNVYFRSPKVTIDHNDYVWCFGAGSICGIWIDEQWKQIYSSAFSESSVWVIKEGPDHRIWLGTENGIYIRN